MKKVIDANYFGNPELEAYFTADKENYAVFPDCACMESYKGNPLKNLSHSLSIVSKYPSQVIILKSTRKIVEIQHSDVLPQDASLEDLQVTLRFKSFCESVKSASAGNKEVEKEIRELGLKASEHFDTRSKDAPQLFSGICGLEKEFGAQDLKNLRTNQPISHEAIDLMAKHIMYLAALLMNQTNAKVLPETAASLREKYIFRLALAAYLMGVHWISVGGVDGVNPKKIENDFLDASYIAYSTYFDGLLTKEKKMLAVQAQTQFFLDKVFVLSSI